MLRTTTAALGFTVASACLAWTANTSPADQLPPNDPSLAVGDDPSARALARALDQRLRVGATDGERRAHPQHCLSADGGCLLRIANMSRIIMETSLAVGVDPFLTAAIAVKETRLNPSAVGSVGERGIIQLHPAYRGKLVPFVYDATYREACEHLSDACQREVLEAGLRLYQWAIDRCGDPTRALGWYNSGSCVSTSYSRSVLLERETLLQFAKATPEGMFDRWGTAKEVATAELAPSLFARRDTIAKADLN